MTQGLDVIENFKLNQTTTSLFKLPDASLQPFWEISLSPTKGYHVVIKPLEFTYFLQKLGIYKFYEPSTATEEEGSNYVFVQAKGKLLRKMTISTIKDSVMSMFDNIPDNALISAGYINTVADLKSEIIGKAGSVFAIDKLEMLEPFRGTVYEAEKLTSCYFFEDCYVEVSAEKGINKHSYTDIDGNYYVWADSVIPFKLGDANLGALVEEAENMDFARFVKIIMGRDKDREASLRSAMGYLLHPYMGGVRKAILLTDEKSAIDSPEGRTGKGIIGQALLKISRGTYIDGKKFDVRKDHAWQQCKRSTRLVVLDDITKAFEAEHLFNAITNDFPINKKFKDEFNLRSKFLINTNTMLKGTTASVRDRLIEIELVNHFSPTHRPAQEFGREFFEDWGERDWLLFYVYMLQNVLLHLRNRQKGVDIGVTHKVTPNLERKRLLANVSSEDFITFMDEQISVWKSNESPKFTIKDIKEKFISENPEFKFLSTRKFTADLKNYCTYKGYDLVEAGTAKGYKNYAIVVEKQLFSGENK